MNITPGDPLFQLKHLDFLSNWTDSCFNTIPKGIKYFKGVKIFQGQGVGGFIRIITGLPLPTTPRTKINHELKFVKIYNGAGKSKPKNPFRLTRNAFKNFLQNFLLKKLFNGIFYWLTDWLPDWLMPSWLRLRAWFFDCSMSLRPKGCLLPCRYGYDTFFIDLAGSSFVSHSSLLPTKGVDFVVGMWWLQFQMEIVYNFNRPRFSPLFTPQ